MTDNDPHPDDLQPFMSAIFMGYLLAACSGVVMGGLIVWGLR